LPDRTEYSLDHVRVLIEEYQAFAARVDTDRAGLNFLVQLTDLDRVLALILPSYQEVVLLHGQLGLDQRAVGKLLQCDHSTVSRRYVNALEEITHHMNRRYPHYQAEV
jgi:DNA-directed RNA polymerase specialized sigma24 family protein